MGPVTERFAPIRDEGDQCSGSDAWAHHDCQDMLGLSKEIFWRQDSLPTLPHCWFHYAAAAAGLIAVVGVVAAGLLADVVAAAADAAGVVVVQRPRPTPGTPNSCL